MCSMFTQLVVAVVVVAVAVVVVVVFVVVFGLVVFTLTCFYSSICPVFAISAVVALSVV